MNQRISNQTPTIADVARRVGVSHTAVSMALRGAAGVSEERRQEILRVAEAMNYQPQIAARLLRSKQTGQLGLLVRCEEDVVVSHGFYMPIMVEFVRYCETEQIGYHIEFFQPREDGTFQPPRQLVGGLVDGTLTAGYIDVQLREWLQSQQRFPWVGLDEPSPVSVLSAMDKGVHAAVAHLVELGHRDIAFVCGPTVYSTHSLARQGFREARQDFGLESPPEEPWDVELMIEPPEDVLQLARQWARRLLSSPLRPSAVYCHDLRVARCLIHEALLAGIRVPEELSVIGGGTMTDAQLTSPIVTVVQADYRGLLQRGVARLRNLINHRRVDSTDWIVPKLCAGETVAPAVVEHVLR